MSPTNVSNGVGGSLNNLLTNYKSPAIITSTRNTLRNGCNKSQVFKPNTKSTGFYLSLTKLSREKSPGNLKSKSLDREPLSP